ncbi:MAG: patatin-like phospholipase family protein [Desulfobacterales bacterium]|jgi:patatin-like phospholipase/acyl hydrolase
MPNYRVLSIEGGGIRGLVSTVLLQRLAAAPGLEKLLGAIDLIAGTSSGGLLALGMAHQIDLAVIRDLFIQAGPKIFDDSWLDDLVDLGKLKGADYDIQPLRRELRKLFGNTTLGQLKKRVLVTAFDLDNEDQNRRTWKPKLFHNFPGNNNDRNEPVYKVGLYTCAAPTYFPSVDGYIDGGVYAVNPSMCALAQTQDRRYQPTPLLDEVVLFSLGTGANLQYIKGRTLDWGYAQWARPLVSLMMDGTAGIADYQCTQILDANYHRLAPVFPTGTTVPMDAVDKIPYLIDFAESLVLDKTIAWLKQHWFAI